MVFISIHCVGENNADFAQFTSAFKIDNVLIPMKFDILIDFFLTVKAAT